MSRELEDDGTDVRYLLTRALDAGTPVGALTVGRIEAAHRAAVHRRRAAVATAAVVTGVLAVVPFALTHPDPGVATFARPAGARVVVPGSDVIRDGDLVEASGRVVAQPGAPVRFCAPTATSLSRHDGPWSPEPCSLGVDVTGVDLQALTRPRTERGMTEGFATLRGVYRSGLLTVTSQSAEADADTPLGRAGQLTGAVDWTTPPCPTPSGGWTRIGENIPGTGTLQRFDQAHPGVLINRVIFRPTPTTMVQVLVVDDPGALRDVLGADASAWCITRSRFPRTQIDEAWRDAGSVMRNGSNRVYAASREAGADAQVTLAIDAVQLTDDLVALVRRHPPGLVRIDPWLTQVAPGQ